MDRLTTVLLDCDTLLNECAKCEVSDCDFCKHESAAIEKLAAYESSGFTPEEVAKFAKYESQSRQMLKDCNDVLAYRLTGLTPNQIIDMHNIVKRLVQEEPRTQNHSVYQQISLLKRLLKVIEKNCEEADE